MRRGKIVRAGQKSLSASSWRVSMLAMMVGTMIVVGITLPLTLHWVIGAQRSSFAVKKVEESHPNVAIARPLEGGVPVRDVGGHDSQTLAERWKLEVLSEKQKVSVASKHLHEPPNKQVQHQRNVAEERVDAEEVSPKVSIQISHSDEEAKDLQHRVHEHTLVVPVQIDREKIGGNEVEIVRNEKSEVEKIQYTPAQLRRDDWNFIHDSAKHRQRLQELTSAAGKVYCAIPSMYTKKKLAMWSAILQTYGPRCDHVKFFVDPLEGNKVPPAKFVDISGAEADIVVLPIVRSGGNCWTGGLKTLSGEDKRTPCKHIWEKVWRMWVYVYENDIAEADWFVKVDDDTFFFPENLKLFVMKKKWRGIDPHYFGHRLVHAIKRPLIAGGAAVMSKGALEKVAPVYKNMEHEYGDRKNFKHGRCVDRDGATEEVTTSICLKSVGITAEPSFDELGREKVMTFPVIDHFLMIRRANSTGWYWKNKDPINRGGEYCCDPKAFAFHHHKRPRYLLRINELIYTSSNELQELAESFDEHAEGKFRSLIQSSSRYEAPVAMMQIKYFLKVRKALEELKVE